MVLLDIYSSTEGLKICLDYSPILCIIDDMIPFFIIMLVLFLMFALTFWTLYDASTAVNICDLGMDFGRGRFGTIWGS